MASSITVAHNSALLEKALFTALEITLNTAAETCVRISGATWFSHTLFRCSSPASASTNIRNGTTAVMI